MSKVPSAMKSALQRELAEVTKSLEQLTERRDAIVHLLETYGEVVGDGKVVPAIRAAQDINSLDMARTVIRNAGRPLVMKDVIDAIRKTYGMDPAKTLADMLYKRSRSHSGFFRTTAGEIGVSGMEAIVETVSSHTAA